MLNIYGGDPAVSTFGILNRLVMFAIMPGLVIGQGLQPILGFNYGAKRYDRALRSMGIAVAAATFLCLSAFFILYFAPGSLIRIFTTDNELISLGIYAAKRVFFLVYLVGFIMVCSVTFQALGKAVQSFITSVSRSALFLLPCVLILPRYLQLDGVWLTFPVTDALTLILVLILIIPQIRDLRKMDLLTKEKNLSRIPGTSRDVQPVVVTGEYNKE
jgi:Na+-driven multidrug efflux pump